jgi:hypothetical protein
MVSHDEVETSMECRRRSAPSFWQLGVRIQGIVDTRCIQRIVDIVVKCIQRIVDIGHTHLNLGGELCPIQLGLNTKTRNFAEPP